MRHVYRFAAALGMIIAVLMLVHDEQLVAAAIKYHPEKVPFLKAQYVSGNLEDDIRRADHVISWQLDHGGWNKNSAELFLSRPWDGQEDRSTWKAGDVQLGTIDNHATNDEILFLALIYRETGEAKYKEAAVKGIDFLLNMQYESGGWPQVYPASGSYSDYVTFNDSAMIRTMQVLRLFAEGEYPFDTDITDAERVERTQAALERGLDYILKSQIIVDGYPTAWCAQHDPFTYEPREGRSYEHPSISGSESVGIVEYLLSLPDPSDDVKRAIVGALRWFDKVKLEGLTFVSGDPNGAYFYYDPDGVIWYRFYEIETFEPIFSGRNGLIKHNIHEIEQERRDGYSWAGSWAKDLLAIKEELPYFKEVSYELDVARFEALKQAKEEADPQTEIEEGAAMQGLQGEEGIGDGARLEDSVQTALPVSEASSESNHEQGDDQLWKWQLVIPFVVAGGMFVLGYVLGRRKRPGLR
jgi:PelA/Pel-15E family pectate lyase